MVTEGLSSYLDHGLVRLLVGILRIIKVDAADP